MGAAGILYIVPTPVGNLEDMTFRAVRVLKEADLILAEDTRTSAVLLQHVAIRGRLLSHHKFNEHQTVEMIRDRILAGASVALVSDAGTPGISDPGFLLARTCAEQGIEVQTLPGATACIPAIVSSGLPCDRERLHLDPLLRAGARQQEARIGDAGRASVAHQGDVQPAQDALLHELDRLVFVEFVVRLKGTPDVVVVKEHRTGTGVFGQDEVRFLQDLYGPEGHIVQVPDRGRDDEKLARHQPSFLRTAIMKLYTMSDLRFQSGNRSSR